jgi:hypothetical protein
MAKPVHGTTKKRGGLKGSTPGAVNNAELSPGKRNFRFPSNSAVKVVASSKAKTAGTGFKKLQRTYKSAGHVIMGTTGDGIVVVRPSGKPDSFALNKLQQAFAGPKKSKDSSL